MENIQELLAGTNVTTSSVDSPEIQAKKESILKASKLDWTVRTEPLVTTSGIETNNIAVIRDDTNKILGVHKSGYQTIQNSKVLDILFELSQKSGLVLHRGGQMKGGELTYLQLKSDDLTLGNDKIVGFITGLNSHNGSISLGFGNANTTISCMNTLYMAYRELSHKIKHTINMDIKIDSLLFQLDKVLAEEQTIFKKIVRMNEIQLDQATKDLVLSAVLGLSKNEKLGDLDTLSTRKKNILFDLNTNIIHQTAEKGENLWGLLSGITRYTTHGVTGEKTENKMIGSYGKKDQLAFELLTSKMEF
jgi:hypothetical protein